MYVMRILYHCTCCNNSYNKAIFCYRVLMYISKKVRENYNLYLKRSDSDRHPPKSHHLIKSGQIKEDKDWHTALEWFNLWDSQWKIEKTNDIENVKKVIIGKGVLNRHMNERAESCARDIICERELKQDYTFPSRVWKAIKRLKWKIIFERWYDKLALNALK